jgi:GAF domain-containing protein
MRTQHELSKLIAQAANFLLACRPEASPQEIARECLEAAGYATDDDCQTTAVLTMVAAWHGVLLAAKLGLSPACGVEEWDSKLAQLAAAAQRRAERIVDEIPCAEPDGIAAILRRLSEAARRATCEEAWIGITARLLACGRWSVELVTDGCGSSLNADDA